MTRTCLAMPGVTYAWAVEKAETNREQVDVVGIEAGRPEGPEGGARGHRCGRLVGVRDAALADPRPGHDPLVVRVDHLLEVGVGEDLVGDVASPAGDVGAADRGALVHHDGVTSMSG